MQTLSERRAGSMGYRAGRLHRLSLLLLDRWLEELGLHYGYVPFLHAVLECEGQTQDELAARATVSCARAARALCAMERDGLVTREENPDNRRQKLVHPTDKARRLQDGFLAVLDRHNDAMLAGFAPQDKQQLMEYMDTMISNLEAEAQAGQEKG